MNYTAQNSSYKSTNKFPEFITNFQEHNPLIVPFINGIADVENFKKQIVLKQKEEINREVLVAELLLQYQNINEADSAIANINLLANTNTFTVTTGHQCCLFGGPLYFIYKIITTINLAKTLKDNIPENNFVPVFWMATEDHDFAEINHIHLLNKKIEFGSEEKGNAVGRISLNNIEDTIAEITELLQNFEFGKEAIAILNECYSSDKTIAEATKKFVHKLFGNHGLVILDADNAELKKLFSSKIENDFVNNQNINLVTENTNQLIASKIIEKSQITPRAVNLFLLKNKLRLRIDKAENDYVLKDSIETFREFDLINLLYTNPETFSPNVVLRPLYQETILPNLAYIGGGAEITYWLQLKTMFAQNKTVFPLLMLRNSAIILEKNMVDKFKNLGFTGDDIFSDSETLQKKYLAENVDAINVEEEVDMLQNIFANLKAKAINIDKSLEGSVDAELSKSVASLKNIEQKIARAQKRNEETSLTQIKKFTDKYFPENELQERHDNFLYFYAKFGEAFLDMLFKEFEPLNNQFLISTVE